MKRLSYTARKAMYGRMFISIWVIGVLLFFVTPFIQTIFYSFNTLQFESQTTAPAGFSHYLRLFQKDTDFIQNLTQALLTLLYEVPIVVMFSVFMAVVLNQRFPGRLFFRAVFFLPVIVMSGVVITLLKGDTNSSDIMQQVDNTQVFTSMTVINDLLSQFGFGTGIIDFISNVVVRVIDTCWKSGVQILLCLAGLQSVPTPLYEAARIEGATKWEEFWKIAFPMLMPVIFINIIYTIIDSFTFADNPMMKYINTVSFSKFEYSYGSAMSLTYCLIIAVIIGLIALVVGRKVTYTEK